MSIRDKDTTYAIEVYAIEVYAIEVYAIEMYAISVCFSYKNFQPFLDNWSPFRGFNFNLMYKDTRKVLSSHRNRSRSEYVLKFNLPKWRYYSLLCLDKYLFLLMAIEFQIR